MNGFENSRSDVMGSSAVKEGGVVGMRSRKWPGSGYRGPIEPRNNFRFYFKCDKKPWEDFEQERDLI